jgi:hypothetical protein
MTERLNEAKKYIELYKVSPNRYEDPDRYWGKAADILMTINKAAINEEEAKEAISLADDVLSTYFSAHPYVGHEKLISFLSGKLSEETCKELTKLLLEEPYWLYFQHLGYGMTIRNILREVCDDFGTLESSWDSILIKAVKRKLGLNEKLPLKCWPCKWNYKETRLSSSGGVRSYDNKAINKKVEIMRSPDSSSVQYWVGRLSDDKEISHGKGLDNLKKKI